MGHDPSLLDGAFILCRAARSIEPMASAREAAVAAVQLASQS